MAKKLNINLDLKNLDLKQMAGAFKNIDFRAIKKYSSLFPSLGLLLAAFVVVVCTLLVGGSIKKKMNDSVSAASTIQSTKNRLSSEAQAREEENFQQQIAKDADFIDALAARTTQREIICYNPVIFPVPKDDSSQVYHEFGKHYRKALEDLMVAVNAKDAPSEAEIRNRTGGAPGGMMGMGGQPVQTNSLVDAICLQRADEIPVYANPADSTWYTFWENYEFKSKEESLKDCWYSQIAFWIYEDVIKTIEVMNSGSGKVSQSAVKRLLGVRFDGPVIGGNSRFGPGGGFGGMEGGMMFGMNRMGGMSSGDRQDVPFYVKDYSILVPVPWTNRKCGEQYDVVHFTLSVVVDSSNLMGFMKELCSAKPHTFYENFDNNGKQEKAFHNQITILQSATEPIVKDNPVHAYYRYGNSAVTRLNLVCEYLFVRKGYDAIKPEPIAKELGQAEGSAETPGATMPGATMPGAAMPGATPAPAKGRGELGI